MRVQRKGEVLLFTFNLMEGRLLRRVFRSVTASYQLKPEQLDPKSAGAWYSTRGCTAAGMSPEEIQEWLAALHGYKSATVAMIQQWSQQLARRQDHQHELQIALQDAPTLVTVLNDHRLLMAARHDIGQDEMDLHPLGGFLKVKGEQQIALLEIHFLSWLIEETLALMPGEPGDWREDVPGGQRL